MYLNIKASSLYKKFSSVTKQSSQKTRITGPISAAEQCKLWSKAYLCQDLHSSGGCQCVWRSLHTLALMCTRGTKEAVIRLTDQLFSRSSEEDSSASYRDSLRGPLLQAYGMQSMALFTSSSRPSLRRLHTLYVLNSPDQFCWGGRDEKQAHLSPSMFSHFKCCCVCRAITEVVTNINEFPRLLSERHYTH